METCHGAGAADPREISQHAAAHRYQPLPAGDGILHGKPAAHGHFEAGEEPYITRLEAAIKKFEKRGYHVVCAPSCYKNDGLGISTKPEDAAADLMKFYLDNKIYDVFLLHHHRMRLHNHMGLGLS